MRAVSSRWECCTTLVVAMIVPRFVGDSGNESVNMRGKSSPV
jgi:hypothetical protein